MSSQPIPPEFVKGGLFLKIGNEQEKQLKIDLSRVLLRIDPHSHILYWIHDVSIHTRLDQAGVKSFLYLQDIVDVRLGKHALKHEHKDQRVSISPELIMTVVSNCDFTHPVFTTFIYTGNDSSVSTWSSFIFSRSLLVRRSRHGFLFHVERILSPLVQLSVVRHQSGAKRQVGVDELASTLIPTKHNAQHKALVQQLTQCFRSGFIPLAKLTNETDLIELLLTTTMGGAVDFKDIFDQLARGLPTVTRQSLLRFLHSTQRDPRLNEAIHPPLSINNLNRILTQLGYPSDQPITLPVFVHYLWSDFNGDTSTQQFVLDEIVMGLPITYYHINSSHNTYCTGLQMKSATVLPGNQHTTAKADVEIYRQILLSGCRCIELDCWDGVDEPIITHGPSYVMRMNEIGLTGRKYNNFLLLHDYPIYFDICAVYALLSNDDGETVQEVCLAIAECAFKTSSYPVMLSIENHLRLSQQKKMVDIFRETFGEMLMGDPLETHPLDDLVEPPSPADMRYKILVKARKVKRVPMVKADSVTSASANSMGEPAECASPVCVKEGCAHETPSPVSDAAYRKTSLTSRDTLEDDEATMNEEKKNALDFLETMNVKASQLQPPKETVVSSDLSRIVNYLQGEKPPKDWGHPDQRYYVMCSLVEEQIMKLSTTRSESRKVIRYNSKKMTRVYPSNWRVTSDNFDPMKPWLLGVQMVALNFQTNCPRMLLNHALFEQNGFCGFVPKSKVLTDPSLNFDPHTAHFGIQQNVPVKLRIKVISGSFLSSNLTDQVEPLSTFVTVEVMHINNRPMYSTQSAIELCSYTQYPAEIMTFGKIQLSELAFVHFTVKRRDGGEGTAIAHRVLLIDKINNGYRHVILRTAGNQCIGPASLFVLFDISHDMPKHQAELRADIADPFANDAVNEAISRALADPLNAINIEFPATSPDPSSPRSPRMERWFEERKTTFSSMKNLLNRINKS